MTKFLEFYIPASSDTCLRSMIPSLLVDPRLGYLLQGCCQTVLFSLNIFEKHLISSVLSSTVQICKLYNPLGETGRAGLEVSQSFCSRLYLRIGDSRGRIKENCCLSISLFCILWLGLLSMCFLHCLLLNNSSDRCLYWKHGSTWDFQRSVHTAYI